MKEIIVSVDIEGDVRIETKGFVGSECRKETSALERALGKVRSDVPTAEASSGSVRNTSQS